MDLSEPQVMGILNVTPDSFYAASRKQTEQEIAECASRIAVPVPPVLDSRRYPRRRRWNGCASDWASSVGNCLTV